VIDKILAHLGLPVRKATPVSSVKRVHREAEADADDG